MEGITYYEQCVYSELSIGQVEADRDGAQMPLEHKTHCIFLIFDKLRTASQLK